MVQTNRELYEAYQHPRDNAGKSVALVEMARRVNMMPMLSASIGKSKAEMHDAEIGIVSVFRQYKLSGAGDQTW